MDVAVGTIMIWIVALSAADADVHLKRDDE